MKTMATVVARLISAFSFMSMADADTIENIADIRGIGWDSSEVSTTAAGDTVTITLLTSVTADELIIHPQANAYGTSDILHLRYQVICYGKVWRHNVVAKVIWGVSKRDYET